MQPNSCHMVVSPAPYDGFCAEPGELVVGIGTIGYITIYPRVEVLTIGCAQDAHLETRDSITKYGF